MEWQVLPFVVLGMWLQNKKTTNDRNSFEVRKLQNLDIDMLQIVFLTWNTLGWGEQTNICYIL